MNETDYDSKTSKYSDDTIFGYISSEYLTLSEEDRKVYNEHVHAIIKEVIELMKEDEIFELVFRRIMYGGSYYKGTKYGIPEEFDMNFIIRLPIDYDDIRIETNHQNFGFVKVKLNSIAALDPDWDTYSYVLDELLTTDNYLDQKKFRGWMEDVLKTALANYETDDGYELCANDKYYNVKYKKSGPAFTLMIQDQDDEDVSIDVDIVPCLEFNPMRLKNGFKPINLSLKKPWMVVPKPLPKDNREGNVLWRPCFYHYEKEILQGPLKPVIRMVKKFRDTKGWDNLASYFIETLFYHELENQRHNENYLKSSKTWLFMHALNQLLKALEKQKLPYFWHSKFNLFSRIGNKELKRYALELRQNIEYIDANIENNDLVLAEVVLTKREVRAIRKRCNERRNALVAQQRYRCNKSDSFENPLILFVVVLIVFIYLTLQKAARCDLRVEKV